MHSVRVVKATAAAHCYRRHGRRHGPGRYASCSCAFLGPSAWCF